MKNYKVDGMTCQGCVNAMQKALASGGVSDSAVSLAEGTGQVRVPDEVTEQKVKAIVEGAGFTFEGAV